MNRTLHKFLKHLIMFIKSCFSLLISISFISMALGQQTAGELEYEVTRQINPDQMRRWGGGMSGGDESGMMPTVITLSQTLRFSGNLATWSTPRPGQQMSSMMPAGAMGQMRRFMPFDSKDYVDFSAGKFLHYVRNTSGEDTTTWFLQEEAFVKPTNWQVEKKTKKILGYECKKATATFRDASYTIWYTTDIKGITFSPINGLCPPEGLVLGIESDEQAFVAKKLDLQATVTSEEVTPSIENAKIITEEEMRAMRRAAGERMRAQFQGQFPRQ
jgi:GLPGLI family protein